MKYIIILTVLFLVGCGDRIVQIKEVPVNCSISNGYLTCPDGTRIKLPKNGEDGKDGINGSDGQDGTLIAVLDPCGDYVHNNDPSHKNSVDEVLMIFNDGTILAYYKNLGLSVLEENIEYRTTDKQKCKFEIVNGSLVEL